MTFCAEIYQQPVPVSKDTLLFFVTYLAQQNLSYATIQVYLLAVKYIQIIVGKSLPLVTPRINYALKSTQRSVPITNHLKDRLPITFTTMTCLTFKAP